MYLVSYVIGESSIRWLLVLAYILYIVSILLTQWCQFVGHLCIYVISERSCHKFVYLLMRALIPKNKSLQEATPEIHPQVTNQGLEHGPIKVRREKWEMKTR